MREILARLYRDEQGASLIEYALLAVLLALACYGAVKVLGSQVQSTFQDAANKLKG